jgi:7,8-dihydropterin-6-yl-methyl-4-(beta-D-ribofuranosyl)aminobenzene 5'-phosphate synthase
LDKLSIYVLVDNVASGRCNAEHGLSYLIEFDKKILFDTGKSDLFLKNAALIQAPIAEIDAVVLSHGHYDHGNGLKYLENTKLICHPKVFQKRYSGKKRRFVGIDITEDEASKKFDLQLTTKPYWLSEKMIFLSQIPRKINFEKHATRFKLANRVVDEIDDDSALVIVMKKGLFIISGCAHSGICNTIEYAKELTGIDSIVGVIGGFHLRFNDKQTQETIHYFKQIKPEIVMPSHCTGLPALSAFYNEFGGEQVKSGVLYTFDN